MRCCFLLFFGLVAVFVQIRLRQQRDALKFPDKFSVAYELGGTVDPQQTAVLNVTKERVVYGNPRVRVDNHTILTPGAVATLHIQTTAPPMTFHRYAADGCSVTALTNNLGVAHSELTCEVQAFFVTHTYDGGDGPAESLVHVSLRNLHYIAEAAVDSDWVLL